MKTPDIYIKLVEKKILTTEIAADVIYSLNKRAKNWRDKNPDKYMKMRQLRMNGNSNEVESLQVSRVLEYYREKDFIILSLFRPQKIHIIDGVEYLYYRVHNSIYHIPVYIYTNYGCKIPEGLKKEKGKSFQTPGENPAKLLSLQFCRRVIELVRDGDFIMIDGGIINIKKSR